MMRLGRIKEGMSWRENEANAVVLASLINIVVLNMKRNFVTN